MNLNRVVITGNLTSDPELRTLQSGTVLCRLRVACNTRRKLPDGSWGEKPNYFDVVLWGAQGENAARYLTRGSGVALDGRLEWREWQTDNGEKRQAVEIVADTIQFLGGGSPSQHRPQTSQPAPAQGAPSPGQQRPSAPSPPPESRFGDDTPF